MTAKFKHILAALILLASWSGSVYADPTPHPQPQPQPQPDKRAPKSAATMSTDGKVEALRVDESQAQLAWQRVGSPRMDA